ncbi:MAG: RNA 3'-terminal phosphate cyclase [Thaumarchaeota archaeon]|nr:RNA 3'-terminal phosphate cyclase [Nitrososphaerota archaeon]
MVTFLEIDGSFGEGGGQTIRTATAFSIILNRPIHVTNVRGGRKIPGLRPQHAATLRILRDVCGATLEGGEIGSTEFSFVPGFVENISPVSLDLGTAGSISLVLQALVPAISLSKGSLELNLTGGTDVPWSPTCDYIGGVLGPCLRRVGIPFRLRVPRRGYYPKGGGKASVEIEACDELRPLVLTSRANGESPPIAIVSRAGMLPRHVAERQASSAMTTLTKYGLEAKTTSVYSEESSSPGSSIMIGCVTDSSYIGSDAIGERNKPAERVGAEAALNFAKAYNTSACVDPNLADMVAPLLLLSPGPSRLLTSWITNHLQTGLKVAELFVDARSEITTLQSGGAMISINPAAK